jgi:hypothetical protein
MYKIGLVLCVVAWILPSSVYSQFGQYNYAPNSINIPLIRKAGDASFSVMTGIGENFRALELQAVYSPVRNLGIMVNYFGAPQSSVRNLERAGTNFFLVEAGIGAYEKYNKGAASLFVGYGGGDLFSYYGVLDHTAAFNLRRLFVQSGFSYQDNRFYSGVAIRCAHLRYRSAKVNYNLDETFLRHILNIEKDGPFFLPELGLQGGLFFKPLTIGISVTSIFPETADWDFVRLNAAVVLSVHLGSKKVSTKAD